MVLSPTVIILAPNSTPMVTSCFCRKRWSINCSKRQDLPTPGVGQEGTCITDDDEFKHKAEGHADWVIILLILSEYGRRRKIINGGYWAEGQRRWNIKLLINNIY